MTKFTILGSGTCNIVPEKAAASVLIEWNDARFVYDFGRGVAARLVEIGLRQDDIEHIVLSHFHPDHVSDLIPFLHGASWSQIDKRTKDLHIYGQPGVKDFFEALRQPYDDHELSHGFTIHVHEMRPGTNTIAGKEMLVVDLHHAFGIRFDDIAIAGDANISDELVGLLKDCRLGIFDAGHISDEEIVSLAVQSGGKKLVCSHQYRLLDEERLNTNAVQKTYTGKLIVARDGMSFDV